MILKLAYYGDPILRQKGAQIAEITDEIRGFVNDMIETLHSMPNAIGLAAPQVHRSLSIFVIEVPELGENKTWTPGVLRVFINPKILSVSENSCIYQEGCLSIPNIYEDVERPIEVTIEAQDLEGNKFVEKFQGYTARAILHENDHVNGVLFVDRIRGKKRQDLEPLLREVKKKYYLKK